MIPPGMRSVHALPRRSVSLGSWSLVEAELDGLRAALSQSRAGHIAIMSGSCYPLASAEAIDDRLADAPGCSHFELHALPRNTWDAPWAKDGGMWRFEHRFLTFGDHLMMIRQRPLPIWRQTPPACLILHGGAQWKVYARHHARLLLQVIDDNPRLRAYWKRMFIPDEACAHSILKSPELVGEAAATVLDDNLWFIHWPTTDPTQHPEWLSQDDADAITAAAQAGKLFARKVGSAQGTLLDFIDATCRS